MMDAYFSIKKILPRCLIKLIDKITKRRYSTILYSTKDNFKENYFKDNFNNITYLFQSHETDSQVCDCISSLVSDFKGFVHYKTYVDFSYMFGLFIENMHSLVIQ